MREGWAYRQIDEICSIDYGTRVVQKNEVGGSKYYVYGGGGATFKIDRFNRENCFIVSRFAMSPKCTRYVSGKFFLNDSGLSVSTKDNKSLRQSFVDKALLANNDVIYAMGKGVAQKNLDMPSFRRLQIPVPPVAEQEKIVDELDCLSGIIEKKKEQLKELDNLAQSIFYDLFGDPTTNEKGWEVKKLGEIAETFIGLTYKPENVVDAGGTIVLRSSNIQESEIDLKDIVRVNAPIKEKHYVRSGDILMCSRNGSFRLVGKVARIKELKEEMSFGAFMTIIRSPLNDYLFAFFKSPAFRGQLTTAKTATINQITTKMLDAISVSLPPVELQNKFARKIEAIEKQKELIKQSIVETETLFNSRMDYWFNN